MSKRFFATLAVALSVIALSGCAAATPATAGDVSWGSPSGASVPPAPAVGTPLDVCAAMPADKLSTLSGRSFTDAKPDNGAAGSYGCSYTSVGAKKYFWEVDVTELPSKNSTGPDFQIASDGPAKSLSGLAYPAIVAPGGIALEWGNDEVIVSDLTTYKVAQATTAQYAAVAEATIAGLK